MPQIRKPVPASPAPYGTLPPCHACGKQMRLIQSTPSIRYANLEDCTFRCECGEQAEYVVARPE